MNGDEDRFDGCQRGAQEIDAVLLWFLSQGSQGDKMSSQSAESESLVLKGLYFRKTLIDRLRFAQKKHLSPTTTVEDEVRSCRFAIRR